MCLMTTFEGNSDNDKSASIHTAFELIYSYLIYHFLNVLLPNISIGPKNCIFGRALGFCACFVYCLASVFDSNTIVTSYSKLLVLGEFKMQFFGLS